MGCRCRKSNKSSSMLTMLDRNTEPNGGYKFRDKSINTIFKAPTLELLTDQVKKYRLSNSIPVTSEVDLMLEIEDQICKLAPPGTCRDVKGQVIMAGRMLTLEDVKRGTAALSDFLKHGGKRVEPEVAGERARTCASCYANVEPQGCSSCSAGPLRELADKVLRELSVTLVGGQGTAYDSHLKSCAYCACQLRAKVWLPLDLLLKHSNSEELERLPEHCWMRQKE